MNTSNNRREESGQILIILTVGIVALLAVTALALDAGMIYSDRRYDQNAADASAYAGAGAAAMQMENTHTTRNSFSCASATPLKDVASVSAVTRAKSNNFTVDYDHTDYLGIDNQHGVEVVCVDSPGSLFGSNYMDVHVMISSTLQTAFAHLFYGGTVRNTVEATVRTVAPGDVGWGFGLATLSPDCKDGLEFTGNGKIVLTGTGAFSNSCLYRRGTTLVCAVPPGVASTADEACDPSIDPDLRPEIDYFTDSPGYIDDGAGGHPDYMLPDPTNVDEQMPRYFLEGEDGKITEESAMNYWIDKCNSTEGADFTTANYTKKNVFPKVALNGKGDTETIKPGIYESITVNGTDQLFMGGGLYCIQDDFVAIGGKIEAVPYTGPDGITYDGVTIVMLHGSMNIAGGVEIDLKAPSTTDFTMRNLLFYAAWGNGSNQTLGGNSDSAYNGTIYAPNEGSLLKIGGTSDGVKGPNYTTQIVAWSIRVDGDATLNLMYDDSNNYTTGALIYLQK